MCETGHKTRLTYKISIESAKWKYARKIGEQITMNMGKL